ncbi:gamma-glutamyl-gamma-aminobutyrate hydrolase family protein [Arthrobacter mobilis]|uniref:Gamma-glutamyl-gamma-aminobutyrate hydrolase family protein n=1 Tax=Arthrobacter mobilis TaxID=2724944 RepID=A0A7X6HBH1_9MICC|nr:gamma-glutamyl-gamma-aminobutyrate hydrolase family protein [Arthrobacter mobilis]NKX53088.1 gamma-glutamyl-gamma-aminobutyrate hydrolase family protein [Arthrobacter mobilis]
MASNVSEPYRPRIGLTTYYQDASWGVWNAPAALLPGTYVEAVVAAGGVPLLLPPLGTDVSVLDVLDGLIVAGGADVDPANYGAEAHELTRSQPLRDAHDLALTRAALQRRVPLFAICRGAQILNVALGGSLLQHIEDSRYQPAPGVFGEVEFTTVSGSIAEQFLGGRASAPCYHHQALETVAPGLQVTAAAADGTVEAVETTSGGWALGVQFHPEQNPADLRLFNGFVEVARNYRKELNGGAS